MRRRRHLLHFAPVLAAIACAPPPGSTGRSHFLQADRAFYESCDWTAAVGHYRAARDSPDLPEHLEVDAAWGVVRALEAQVWFPEEACLSGKRTSSPRELRRAARARRAYPCKPLDFPPHVTRRLVRCCEAGPYPRLKLTPAERDYVREAQAYAAADIQRFHAQATLVIAASVLARSGHEAEALAVLDRLRGLSAADKQYPVERAIERITECIAERRQCWRGWREACVGIDTTGRGC